MAGLTVTEKEHWKQRIAARIEKRVEAIKARNPAPFDRIKRDAREAALETLGLTEAHAELETVRAEEQALGRRRSRAQRALVAALRRVPPEEVNDTFPIRYGEGAQLPVEVAEAI